MIPIAFSLQQAADHFLAHPGQLCKCMDGERSQEARTYEEAQAFFLER